MLHYIPPHMYITLYAIPLYTSHYTHKNHILYPVHHTTLYSYTLYPYLQVISVETEEELLIRWKEFVCACDPDVITGYNIG